MTQIVLAAITPDDVGERPVVNTGVSMLGMGGDDYVCGHCGRLMMHNFDAGKMQAAMVYQCGGCGGFNVKPK
ncbi:MAG: hypothetical protein ACM33T_07215 [Solirubrobacterales bacterium]